MTRVFISHSSKDNEFTRTLRDHLRTWGHETWVDFDDIPAGSVWMDEIDETLINCDVIVDIVTPDSMESTNVRKEWNWALLDKKPFYLVYLRETQFRPQFADLQYIDFRQDQETGFSRLRAALSGPVDAVNEDHKYTPTIKSASTKNDETNRNRMLEKVHTFWINGVLLPNLVRKIFLELESVFAPEAVQPDIEVQNPNYETFTLKGGAVGEIFNRLGRELLILGDPGSGKTMTLLELARDLIAQAEMDDSLPIPVIFNLSSWAAECLPLEQWLVERLFVEYQVPRKVGEKWLANGELLLLLDGLDEVILDDRDECIRAINDFWKAHDEIDNGIVVCSRINDYNMLTERLHLENAIVLRPLETWQAERYIDVLGSDWQALRDALPQNQHLKALSKSPLLLNIMAVAYRGAQPNEITGFKSEDDQRRNLLERYVARRLRENKSDFDNDDTRHWLTWVAARMVENGLTVFHLEGLQPDWLHILIQQRSYRLFFGLQFGVICGLVGGLVGGLVAGIMGWIIIAACFMLIGGLIGNFVRGLEYEKIAPVEALMWSRERVISGLFFGIFSGLVGGLGTGLFFGLFFGLFVVLCIGLVFGLFFGMTPIEAVETRTRSNQGIRRSLRSALRIALGSGLVGGLFLGLSAGPFTGMTVFLFFGLFVGSTHDSGEAVLRHYTLRFVLWRANYTPRPDRYVAFLDDAARRQLLRKVGGGYIFRHRMLQEYFASLETQNESVR